jgi:hypothetical protein
MLNSTAFGRLMTMLVNLRQQGQCQPEILAAATEPARREGVANFNEIEAVAVLEQPRRAIFRQLDERIERFDGNAVRLERPPGLGFVSVVDSADCGRVVRGAFKRSPPKFSTPLQLAYRLPK